MGRHIVIPVFIPHMGCRNDCVFCNQKKISGQSTDMTIDKMSMIVKDYTQTIKTEDMVELSFYGGSFTGLPTEEMIKFLKEAKRYLESGVIKGIRLSTRPDYIDNKILDILKEYEVSTIELGAQSLDDDVLRLSGRGHTSTDVYKASSLIKEYGIKLGIQTMLGLPGDNREKALFTAHEVCKIKPSTLRIYPTLIIKGTHLEHMYNSGEYEPLSLSEAVVLCAKLCDIYEENNINIIRIGLQPTEEINYDCELVAGPFHPAFRQLVNSKRALEKIEKYIKEKSLENESGLVLRTRASRVSDVIGNRKENLLYLREKYGYRKIDIKIVYGDNETDIF